MALAGYLNHSFKKLWFLFYIIPFLQLKVGRHNISALALLLAHVAHFITYWHQSYKYN